MIELNPFSVNTYDNFGRKARGMNQFSLKIATVSALVLFFSFNGSGNATFFGEVKTGLQNVSSDRYGYSLFVPKEYTPDQKWPLVMALHDEGERGEDYIQTWVKAAQERGMIVFCPNYEAPKGGLPFDHDRRLLELKRAVENQYEIDPGRVLMVGFGSGGHYAFYLSLRYPKEFSAIASVGNAAKGSFEKLFAFSYARVNQLPVLMLVERQDEIADSPETLAQLKTFEERGYLIETVEAEAAGDLADPNTNDYILEWFQQVSSDRESSLQKYSFNLKQKFYEWVDNLLQNR